MQRYRSLAVKTPTRRGGYSLPPGALSSTVVISTMTIMKPIELLPRVRRRRKHRHTVMLAMCNNLWPLLDGRRRKRAPWRDKYAQRYPRSPSPLPLELALCVYSLELYLTGSASLGCLRLNCKTCLHEVVVDLWQSADDISLTAPCEMR